jgi:hypothetical protein
MLKLDIYVARHNVSRQEVSAARRVAKTIRRWLSAYGAKSKDVNEFSSRVLVLLITKGRAGAAEYLKRVGFAIQQYLADGVVRSHIGVSLKEGLPSIIPDSFREVTTVLSRLTKVYRAIEVLDVPRAGVEKLVNSIHNPPIARDEEAFELVRHAIQRGWESIGSPTVFNGQLEDPPLAIKPLWVRDGMDWRCITSLEYRDVLLGDICFSSQHLSHSKLHTVFGLLDPDDLYKIADQHRPLCSKYAGDYSFTLESGGKVRGFFSPRECIQALSTPILKAVARIRDTIPEDCNTNQLKGVYMVQDWLRQGLRVSSVDQTAATDRFPLELQLFACSLIGIPEEDLSFMETVSRLPFQCTEKAVKAGFPNEVTLSVGQPMGTKFSIGVYGLTMALLLKGLSTAYGQTSDCFVVLNDDVAVASPVVADRFIELMTRVGVEINISKSWDSGNYAEFAGHSITRDSAVVGGKWSEVTPANLLSYARRLPGWIFSKYGIRKKVEMFHHMLWGHPVHSEATVEELIHVSEAVASLMGDCSLFDNYFCRSYEERESNVAVVGKLFVWLSRTYGVRTQRVKSVDLLKVVQAIYDSFPELNARVGRDQWVDGVHYDLVTSLSQFCEESWQTTAMKLCGYYCSHFRHQFGLEAYDVMQRTQSVVSAVEEQLWYPGLKPDGTKNSVRQFNMAHKYLSSVG